MLIFGWGDGEPSPWRGQWWKPFFRISLDDAIAVDATMLWERVIKESLDAGNTGHSTRVAIGCG